MTKILIVGAGPTGLTAATELARLGITPTVIDKREQASSFSRAVGIQPASMEILAPSGAAEAIRAEAVILAGAMIHKGAKPVARIRTALIPDPFERILALAQDRTEHHLLEAFKRYGGDVRFGAALQSLSQDADKVTATIDNKAEEFDYVIGADGTRSTVRQQIGLAYEGFDLDGTWSIADVDVKGLDNPTFARIHLMPKGVIGLVVPLEAKRYRVISNTPDALATVPVDLGVTKIRRQGAFTISIRQVEQYSKGRVYLAGDAAHSHSPAGGRGMNLGIADAADLARRFVNGGLDGYTEARHAEGVKVLEFSERARKIVTSSNPFKKALFFMMVGIVDKVPFLNRKAVMQLLRG